MIGTVNERSGSKSLKYPPSRSQVSANHSPPAETQRSSHDYAETNADNQGTRRPNPRYAHVIDSFEKSIDRIFTDLIQDREQVPSRRRYSLNTLTWALEIVTESPAADRTMRRIFPLPSERLLQERFMNFQLRIRHTLTDIEEMGFVVEIWREVNGIEQVTGSVPVIL
jgi:hypothetical protein